MVSDNETFGFCDLSKGFGYCWTTPGTVENRPFFRYHFLEGMALVMLGHLYWTPIHADIVVDVNGVPTHAVAVDAGGTALTNAAYTERSVVLGLRFTY